MQPSIAAFIGSSKNLFERSEFIFAPMKARSAEQSRSDQIVGWPFLWFVSFGHSKEMNTQLRQNENKTTEQSAAEPPQMSRWIRKLTPTYRAIFK
jgi:hypothetical protein